MKVSFAAVDPRVLLDSAVQAVSVLGFLVLGKHVHELPLVEDQHLVVAFVTDGADPSLGEGVGLRRSRGLRNTEMRTRGLNPRTCTSRNRPRRPEARFAVQ